MPPEVDLGIPKANVCKVIFKGRSNVLFPFDVIAFGFADCINIPKNSALPGYAEGKITSKMARFMLPVVPFFSTEGGKSPGCPIINTKNWGKSDQIQRKKDKLNQSIR